MEIDILLLDEEIEKTNIDCLLDHMPNPVIRLGRVTLNDSVGIMFLIFPKNN